MHSHDPAGYALIAIALAATGLAFRRPRAALAVVTLALATSLVLGSAGGPAWACGPITLFLLARRADRRTAVLGGVATAGVLSAASLAAGHVTPLLPLVFVGWSAAAVALGQLLRGRRGYLAALEERARFLERTREEEALRRVAEERLRIARDLHDGVAHALATINVQAAAAGHVLAKRPEAVAGSLAVIERTSATVLDELATMLSVLREPDERGSNRPLWTTAENCRTELLHSAPPNRVGAVRGTAVDHDGDGAEERSAPGLAGIGRLIDNVRAAGIAVSFSLDGPTRDVSPVQATAAYRIVQESLTNVIRHADATAVRVTLRVEPGHALRLEVRDDGVSRPAPAIGGKRGPVPGAGAGAGVGIQGMRERAEATGGRLEAGPAEGGGFRVHARWEARP